MHIIIIAQKVVKMTRYRFRGRYDNRPDHTIEVTTVRRVKDNLRVFGPGRLGKEMPCPYGSKFNYQLFAGFKNKCQAGM